MLENLPGWLAVGISALALGYTAFNNTARKSAAKIKALDDKLVGKADAAPVLNLADRVDRLEDRSTKIEAELQHLPNKDQTHRLEVAVENIEGQVNTLAASMKPIAAMASRIQDVLIDQLTKSPK